jgi:7,8-dihydropterin-6-yl-methyl-4-(beta-D-ribofuranosyl)aminobenzene 5'-phosphate synthase
MRWIAEAAKINSHVQFVAGGFHLVVAQDPAIEKVAASLHDTYKVDYIAPGHCTGKPAFAAVQKAFGDRYLYAGQAARRCGLRTSSKDSVSAYPKRRNSQRAG